MLYQLLLATSFTKGTNKSSEHPFYIKKIYKVIYIIFLNYSHILVLR